MEKTTKRKVPEGVFDPPTELDLPERHSFLIDRQWAGNRAAEIVRLKFGGYDEITDDQIRQAFNQAWEELRTIKKHYKPF